LHLAAADVARAEALLELAGAESLSLGDAGDDPVLEPRPGETPLWPDVVIRALFGADVDFDALRRLLEQACASVVAFRVEPFDEAAWRRAARRGFTARRFGERLWLAPAEDMRVPHGLIGVRLHMGLAFGTGEHPTTALCLDWLATALRPGATVLDYGCGSGVLAIAALKLGAARAVAVDIDPQALEAARYNSERNGVHLELHHAQRAFRGEARLTVANILANPLRMLAPVIASHTVAGGSIALSGILEEQASDVIAAYAPWARLEIAACDEPWVLLAGPRR